MKVPPSPIKKFVIVGGGTAGWLAAAALGNIYKDSSDVEIELVESDEIGIIGVGEATIPPFVTMLESLGIDLVDFIKHTQATFKLGIEFTDWRQHQHSYFHPFGSLGATIDGHDFYQCWLKASEVDSSNKLMDHSPEAQLAKLNRFFVPHKCINTSLANTKFALHLDSSLAGQYLRRFAEARGVKRTVGTVEQVVSNDGIAISHIMLSDGRTISADFFIDCTGFKGLLIEQSLNAGYEDWSEYLPCNKAVTVQTENTQTIRPYTLATAREAGWTWNIPLQHRSGNGYVYCDKFISDEQAMRTLLSCIEGNPINQPRIIPFTTGLRKQPWKGNCLSLGLAQGFLEPLESTAIHLVTKSLALFIRLFPSKESNPLLINEFNRRIKQDYVEIRDFLILHYCSTERTDSAFWRWCKNMPIPESLQHKIDLFSFSGALIPGVEELFQPSSWYAVFDGLGLRPERPNPTVYALDADKLTMSLRTGSKAIREEALKQPTHMDFLYNYCQAKPPTSS